MWEWACWGLVGRVRGRGAASGMGVWRTVGARDYSGLWVGAESAAVSWQERIGMYSPVLRVLGGSMGGSTGMHGVVDVQGVALFCVPVKRRFAEQATADAGLARTDRCAAPQSCDVTDFKKCIVRIPYVVWCSFGTPPHNSGLGTAGADCQGVLSTCSGKTCCDLTTHA